jgi:hypothetical protein
METREQLSFGFETCIGGALEDLHFWRWGVFFLGFDTKIPSRFEDVFCQSCRYTE